METKLRQRVIGAVVLAACAVIFLPMLFKGSNSNSTPQQVMITEQIPTPPPKPTANDMATPVANANGDVNNQPVQNPGTTVSTTTNTNPAQPAGNANADSVFTANQPAANVNNTNNVNANMNQSAANQAPVAAQAQIQTVPVSGPNQAVANNSNNNPPVVSSNTSNSPVAAPAAPSDDEDMASAPNSSENTAAIAQKMDSAQNKVLAEKPIPAPKKLVVAHKIKPAPKPAAVEEEQPADVAATEPAAKPATKHKVVAKAKPAEPIEKTTAVATDDTAVAPAPKATSGSAFVVQLGAFSDDTNAKLLEKQLRGRGFAAYLQKTKTAKGSLTKVLIGPETQRTNAALTLSRLEKELQLKGVVVPFEPLPGK